MPAIIAPINDVRELETLVTIQAGKPNSGLVVFPDAFTEFHREEIVALIVRHRVPAVNWSRSFADGGGLISYGPYLVDEHRRAATYADRILKGEKPADLPVQAPTKYELAINLKTAKALGLTVPPALLARADDLIE
jgi:putative ABC transport system substrate-binding protein